METSSAIRERRSSRKFIRKRIENSKLYKILDSARWAPSAGNINNVRIIVVEDQKKKGTLARAALGQEWMLDAHVLLVVCSLTEPVERAYGNRGRDLYAVQNTSTAIENIILAAQDEGVSAGWVGAFEERPIRRALKIYAGVDIHAIIALGYAAAKSKAPPKLELADMVYWDQWEEQKRHAGQSLFPIGKHLPMFQKKAKSAAKKAATKVNKSKTRSKQRLDGRRKK